MEQASKELKKGSSASLTEVGQNKDQSRGHSGGHSKDLTSNGVAESESGYNDEPTLDHVDAINQIFAEFEFAYHNQFHKAFSDVESQLIAKKYWLSSLEEYSPSQIVQAAKRVIRTQDFLPSIAVLVRACEQGFDLFGLPSTRQAYFEACSAPSPKRDYNWSHEAVFLAGKAAGWFVLANEPEKVALPVFEYHYALLCKRVIGGEHLDTDVQIPLAATIARKLDKNEARARIAKMRKELGI
ncbi:MAG: hypothetical protein COA96_04185 [SAR86 cluster bacterium]|uniref:Replicative helicase inhibitor G39P N-terminal domain-containing protein n=1 Tax=SAR86 cluster bacterium TaxID=2030880 RepID=A0A2A5B5L7_9GAMM|nr:MAG: hypothetical protein COA96_04185 [SAR86 cluster bacterium]